MPALKREQSQSLRVQLRNFGRIATSIGEVFCLYDVVPHPHSATRVFSNSSNDRPPRLQVLFLGGDGSEGSLAKARSRFRHSWKLNENPLSVLVLRIKLPAPRWDRNQVKPELIGLSFMSFFDELLPSWQGNELLLRKVN